MGFVKINIVFPHVLQFFNFTVFLVMNTGRHCLKVTKKSPQGRKEKYCYEEWKLTKFLLFDVY